MRKQPTLLSKNPVLCKKKTTKSFEGIWGKIRQGLIDYYGTGGDAMDNAWFSKLTANVDADNKKLTLKAREQIHQRLGTKQL
jgi:hypothetical protein